MSHFVSINTQIKDLEALRSACAEMGLELLEKGEARGVGTVLQGDYIIRLKGPCDIAVQRDFNGTFALSTDWWGGHVEKETGKNYGRLLQLYAIHKTTREASRRGLSVQRKLRTDGSVKLTIRGV
jgi:hypothetical protein